MVKKGYTRHFLGIFFLLLFSTAQAAKQQYQTVDWTDLLPQSDLDALLNAPEIEHNSPEVAVEPGSLNAIEVPDPELQDPSAPKASEAQPPAFGQGNDSTLDPKKQAAMDAYQQALVSNKVRPEMHKKKIRIAGFIVPLEFSDNYIITEFLLVPFFGACVHVPPPPPNQIIHVVYEPGKKLEFLYDPFWIEGTLFTTATTSDLAETAYSMEADRIEVYSD